MKFADMQVYKYTTRRKYTNMQLHKYANTEICNYTSIQMYKYYATIQIFKYTDMQGQPRHSHEDQLIILL